MKKSSEKNVSVNELAVMVASGFQNMQERIDGRFSSVEDGLRVVEDGLEEVKLRLDNVPYRLELTDLQQRVGVLERRAGIRHK